MAVASGVSYASSLLTTCRSAVTGGGGGDPRVGETDMTKFRSGAICSRQDAACSFIIDDLYAAAAAALYENPLSLRHVL